MPRTTASVTLGGELSLVNDATGGQDGYAVSGMATAILDSVTNSTRRVKLMRHWLICGLTLAVASSVAAAPALKSDEQKDQQTAVELVGRLRGQVAYDYQKLQTSKPNTYDFKATAANPEAFHRVIFVDLHDTRVTDHDLKALSGLTALENLDLRNTEVTSTGMVNLKRLTKMLVLGLGNTKVDDSGLAHLKGMTRLWQLTLDGTPVTDRGLEQLKGLVGLEEWLGLTHTAVTDEGLKHLEGMTKLRNLNLSNTKVTAIGVNKLRMTLKSANIDFDR